MTEEELKKVPFHFVGSLSMEDEHCITYSSTDGRLGFCVHTRKIDEFTFGRSHRHWRIGDKIYKSKKKFLEALADFHPQMTMDKLKEMNEK